MSSNSIAPFSIALPAGVALAAAGWLALVAGQLGNPTPSWVHHAYELKQRAADAIHQPKIVIVSGSNALFGINSSLLSREYQRPVVNQGVNAAMRLPFILYRSKLVLKRGDVALLPLEYDTYLYNGEPNAQEIDQILSREPEFIWQLGWYERFKVLWETPFDRVWEGYHPSDAQPPVTAVYGIHNIDPTTGDQLHTEKARRVGTAFREWQAMKAHAAYRYAKEDDPKNLSWRYLRSYLQWAKQEGVCVIFLPSVLQRRPLYREDSAESAFYTDLPKKVKALGANYVGAPFDFMYDDDDLFNTDYHLTDEARQRHTRKIIDALGPSLDQQCSSTPPR